MITTDEGIEIHHVCPTCYRGNKYTRESIIEYKKAIYCCNSHRHKWNELIEIHINQDTNNIIKEVAWRQRSHRF